MTIEPLDSDVYLDSRAVRRRYGGRSEMSLWRWSRDPKLGFPQPIYIQKYRYWRLSDLIEWERNRPQARQRDETRPTFARMRPLVASENDCTFLIKENL